jgi:hypothetical protein
MEYEDEEDRNLRKFNERPVIKADPLKPPPRSDYHRPFPDIRKYIDLIDSKGEK